MATRLIFGCGYLGERVAERWLRQGDSVTVVTRSQERSAILAARGYATIRADVTDRATLRTLPTVDTLLFAVGYDRSAPHTIDQVYAQGLASVLAELSPAVGRIVYISTTGVYGNAHGDWIDETTPPAPARPGGAASLAAEEHLRQSRFVDRSVILRLAGIYGPGRLPYLETLRRGEPIEAPRHGYLNLIHVFDAARVVQRVGEGEGTQNLAGPSLYCVSDGHPPRRDEFYQEIARQLNAPPVQFVEPKRDSPKGARAASDKRVSNRKLLADFGPLLRYSDYRTGLAQVLGSANTP